MLQSILAVTITAPDLDAVEKAYRDYLRYEVMARGVVSRGLAGLWRAPKTMGREYLLLQPLSGEPVFLRFVQADQTGDYQAMKSFGWNATEILVKDPDQLAVNLAGSPFKIIGEPRGLSSNEQIRAMQVVGPVGELLYLTSIPEGESVFHLGSARTEIDRVFIVVLGGRDLEAMRRFYADKLKLPVTAPMGVRISVLSNAYGMDPEDLHQLALVRMPEKTPEKFLIEIDQYPSSATERVQREGELPSGMAMVSFIVNSLDRDKDQAMILSEAPYAGRRTVMLKGAAGELIELVEA